ncbi:Zn-dependent hydrolase [candidate division MSBL1 archaeon SCGC-AAA385D11]|uniref:Zn-dependent hydrolase n=1 Tax=candidate division MSBL1 archaeon SCGC-AAA385D11 TaxID=1698286 RepID=A0A133VPK2_9EURY|nr:Zn-dependent hydrolase [candidate division MSBL1 archaeon SCGC-AAA385D11]
MRVRWLGNACIEMFGEKHVLIDPNFTTEPERKADLVLLTHEHDDHFSKEDYKKFSADACFAAPRASLEKFDLKGRAVKPGDKIDGVEVFESDCWKSKESVSYFYRGVLHAGDSAFFPDIEGVKLIFSACFPDYYEDYVSAFKRLGPDLVVPFHYDPIENLKDAEGLMERLSGEGIACELLDPGEDIEIK